MFYYLVSSEDEKPARKSKKPAKFEAQQTIKEGYGQTYNKPMVWGIDGGKKYMIIKIQVYVHIFCKCSFTQFDVALVKSMLLNFKIGL